MKKLVFLMTPLLALLLAGCLASKTPLSTMHGSRHNSYALTDSRTPENVLGKEARGVRLSLSARSSVKIDVECILDYVQGGPDFTPEYETDNQLIPWLRFDYAY